ncbi:MAG: outer membrane protein assembly factor BamA, partial [Rhodospirillales bacterium]|nr:outer membrane protein assembly factor BamA [Rhodospirillales bacterium]
MARVKLIVRVAAQLVLAGILFIGTHGAIQKVVAQEAPQTEDEAIYITEIVTTGNQRIEADTVRAYMAIRRGSLYNREEVDKSLKDLFSTGLFADVTI